MMHAAAASQHYQNYIRNLAKVLKAHEYSVENYIEVFVKSMDIDEIQPKATSNEDAGATNDEDAVDVD